ncbi:hypothetical protein FA13DRAFT_1734122 [Coprinellus micaceus]|uniref:Uncharacterized protein n=1 Tax=Coprinellus micaceus TaxID=71717 RepID=A0A4Y7T717_COPMI|nr:hypothetical protein FA13DRAFT_1734122 [Coprinellus micaceus]
MRPRSPQAFFHDVPLPFGSTLVIPKSDQHKHARGLCILPENPLNQATMRSGSLDVSTPPSHAFIPCQGSKLPTFVVIIVEQHGLDGAATIEGWVVEHEDSGVRVVLLRMLWPCNSSVRDTQFSLKLPVHTGIEVKDMVATLLGVYPLSFSAMGFVQVREVFTFLCMKLSPIVRLARLRAIYDTVTSRALPEMHLRIESWYGPKVTLMIATHTHHGPQSPFRVVLQAVVSVNHSSAYTLTK